MSGNVRDYPGIDPEDGPGTKGAGGSEGRRDGGSHITLD